MSSLKGAVLRGIPCHPQSPLISCFLSDNQKVPDFYYKLPFSGAVYKSCSSEISRRTSKLDEHFSLIIVPSVLWDTVSLGNFIPQKPTWCLRVSTCSERLFHGLGLLAQQNLPSPIYFSFCFLDYIKTKGIWSFLPCLMWNLVCT